MKSPKLDVRHWAALAALGLAGCPSYPVESPTTTVTQETDVRVEQNVKNKVDIIFLIDDSPSMSPKQQELQKRFPELIKVLDSFAAKGSPASYHIGVVTSDLGAAQSNGSSNCKPGGLGARLQVPAGPGILNRTRPANCMGLTLGGGVNYIDYNQLNNTNNLPNGADLPTTFTCMASVGDVGCGFEHQLESVYRALHDCMPDNQGNYPNCTIPENKGFLRPDSILAVVYVTDEDDCSADPNSDLFDLNKTSTYGALLSYRCTQYGIECGNPPALPPYMDSNGVLDACVPAPNMGGAGPGKLFDVQKYIDFLTKPAPTGVRVDPKDVIIAAITAPSAPVQVIVGAPATYQPCAAGQAVDGTKCAVLLQHSCFAPPPLNTTFFGDPAVRINAVVAAAGGNGQQASICDTDYTPALQTLGMAIVSKIGAGCLSSPVANPDDPDCIVEDVTNNPDGTTTINEIASCVRSPGANPCWALQQNQKCDPIINPKTCMPEQFGVGIGHLDANMMFVVRQGTEIPANTNARVACATIAHSSTDNCQAQPSPGP